MSSKVDSKFGFRPSVPKAADVYKGPLVVPGRWAVAYLEQNSVWTAKIQKKSFRGEDVWLIPTTEEYLPAIAVKLNENLEYQAAWKILLQFLSALSWVREHGYVVRQLGGGSRLSPMVRPRPANTEILIDAFDLSYFPETDDPDSLLALALLREGRGLNHPAYSYVSFYRVLEVAIKKGRKRRLWVAEAINKIEEATHFSARNVISELKDSGVSDIGEHLYTSNRHAIAHAQTEKAINPDDPDDYNRLSKEAPLIEELAILSIEQFFNIKTNKTLYDEHLYELQGFKEILGDEIIIEILKKNISENTQIDIPEVDIKIFDKEEYSPLIGMSVSAAEIVDRGLRIQFSSRFPTVFVEFILNFSEERIEFDIDSSIFAGDDGSVEAATALVDLTRFFRDYVLNGKLQIYNSSTQKLLSRKDPYIPFNMRPNFEKMQENIEKWRAEVSKRKIRDREYGMKIKEFDEAKYNVVVNIAFGGSMAELIGNSTNTVAD